jgi:RNA polymerase sigma-70 factor, ECF subfamily
MLRRLGQHAEAADAYAKALALAGTDAERRYLARRQAEVAGLGGTPATSQAG